MTKIMPSRATTDLMLAIERIGLSEAYEKMPDGVIVCNGAGNICIANSRVTVLLGWARQELLGKPISILIPESVRDRHDEYFEHWMRHPTPRSMGTVGAKVNGLHHDGGEIPLYIELSYVDSNVGILPLASLRYRGEGNAPSIDDHMDRAWVLKEDMNRE